LSALTLSQIFIYPIKSLGGIPLTEAQVEERGLQYDRRWMLTDLEGQLLTQRAIPQMALLDVEVGAQSLRVTHRRQPIPPLDIPLTSPLSSLVRVTVWDDTFDAAPVSQEADQWFSKVLGTPSRLVYLPDHSVRRVDEKYVPESLNVSFADGYPLLIIGQGSLDELNARLTEALPMNRFRPNLIFVGGAPHEEDTWQDFQVGSISFRGVKPCARCVMTTIDQQTAEKGAEPLKTLATYRRSGHKILFGQNLIALSAGKIRVGDKIEVTGG
jgi:hypothetical protein